MIIGTAKKDPDAVLPYSIELSTWLASLDGETIDTVVWAVDAPTSPTLTVDSSSEAGTIATAIVSGGTEGTTYLLRCRVTTDPTGYVEDFVLSIRCET